MTWRRGLAWATGATLVAVAAVLFRTPLLVGCAAWLDVGEPPRTCDLVVALPGDEQHRPPVAAAMVEQKLARGLLIVPTADSSVDSPQNADSTVQLTQRFYAWCQLSDQVEILPGASRSTADDLQILQAYLQVHPEVSLAIVTSDYHTRRARWIASRVLGAEMRRVSIVSAPAGDFHPATWWQSEDGFLLVTSEYVKLLAYWFVYGAGVGWLVALTTALYFWPCCWRRYFSPYLSRKRLWRSDRSTNRP